MQMRDARDAPSSSSAESTSDARTTVRLAVATTLTRPLTSPTTIVWLRHHREVVGVVAFHLRIEGGPSTAALPSPWNECIHMYEAETESSHATDGVAACRLAHVLHASTICRRDGSLTHLLDLDEDELLYLPNGVHEFLAALQSSPRRCAYQLRSFEALSPSPYCANPFSAATTFQCQPSLFCAYRHGRCDGVLGERTLHSIGSRAEPSDTADAEPSQLPPLQLPQHAAVVLSYEDATFDGWLHNWLALYGRHAADGARTLRAHMVSPYHFQSLKLAGVIHRAMAAATDPLTTGGRHHEALHAAHRSALRLWCKHKLQPRTPPAEAVDGIKRMPVGKDAASTAAVWLRLGCAIVDEAGVGASIDSAAMACDLGVCETAMDAAALTLNSTATADCTSFACSEEASNLVASIIAPTCGATSTSASLTLKADRTSRAATAALPRAAPALFVHWADEVTGDVGGGGGDGAGSGGGDGGGGGGGDGGGGEGGGDRCTCGV